MRVLKGDELIKDIDDVQINFMGKYHMVKLILKGKRLIDEAELREMIDDLKVFTFPSSEDKTLIKFIEELLKNGSGSEKEGQTEEE